LVACAVKLGDDATGVLARLGGSLGAMARSLASELAALPADQQPRRRAEHRAAAGAVVPEGLRRIHASWIEAALSELPARARTAVAAGGGEPADVWLARWATASLPPMPVERWHDELEQRLARPHHDVTAWLAGIA